MQSCVLVLASEEGHSKAAALHAGRPGKPGERQSKKP